MRKRGGILLLVGLCLAHAAAAAPHATVVVESKNTPALAQFYEKDLGLTVVAFSDSSGVVVLDAAGTELVLTPRHGKERGNRAAVRILLPVTDWGAARERLSALGIPYREASSPDGSVRALFFRDPENNPLGFVPSGTSAEAWLSPLRWDHGRGTGSNSGRTELMVYAGAYGLWSGMALPAGFGADSPTPYGISLIAAPTLAVYGAYRYATGTHLTLGQARLVTVAGNWGTWQGIGWSWVGDAEGRKVVLTGMLTGLGSLVASGWVAPRLDVSAGQATVLHSGLAWGAWYGLVGAEATGAVGDDVDLQYMLIGSSAGLALGALWSAGHDIEARRARLISLGGLLGTAFGFGMDLILQPPDTRTAWVIPGFTGLAGMGAAALWTRERKTPLRGANLEIGPAPSAAGFPNGGFHMSLVRAGF